MTPKERQSRAIEARQFLENPMLRVMFDGVSETLEKKALSIPSTDKELAADVIRCKQLLAGMKREIERRAEDGDFAAFELEQLERQGIRRLFRR